MLQLKRFLNYVAFLRSRLAAQILAGRLVIEQSIVARDLGMSSLTINMEWTEWSSAHEAGKASAGRHRTSFSLCAKEKSFCLRRPSRAGEGLDYRRKLTSGMRRPFGRDLPGEAWTGLVEIIRCLLVTQGEMQDRQKRGEHPGWYDIHTRRFQEATTSRVKRNSVRGGMAVSGHLAARYFRDQSEIRRASELCRNVR